MSTHALSAAPPQVTLVDREPRFLFKPLMYELLMGELTTDEVAPPFSTLLTGTRVKCVCVRDVCGHQSKQFLAAVHASCGVSLSQAVKLLTVHQRCPTPFHPHAQLRPRCGDSCAARLHAAGATRWRRAG